MVVLAGLRTVALLCTVLVFVGACTSHAVPEAVHTATFPEPGAAGQGAASEPSSRPLQRSGPASDAVWTVQQRRIIHSLSLAALPALPPDPSNRYADDPRAIALGRLIFFDTRFSLNQKISCATCHRAELAFADGLTTARGIGESRRNTPGLIGAAWQTWYFWDGRRDSLWAQALTPFEAPHEMGVTRVEVVRTVAADAGYRRRYETLFGALPSEVLGAEMPQRAGPIGDAATVSQWRLLPDELRRRINIAFANIGKSIAAYERTLAPMPTRFDRYAASLAKGDFGAAGQLLDADEIAGLRLFMDVGKTGCLNCHNGPLFTNHDFHNIGTGVMGGVHADRGRSAGIAEVRRDEFNCVGAYSDAARAECTALRFMPGGELRHETGAFKVPSLRNVSVTGPYLHDGRFATLDAVLEHYRRPPEQRLAGLHEIEPLDLMDTELKQLVRFLQTLTEPRFEMAQRRVQSRGDGK